MSSTRSVAWSRPSGWATHSPPGSPGGSPRRARMLRTPDAAYRPTTWRSAATDAPTQVRWASGVSVVSRAIRSVTRTVRSWLEPPAPYVTETKSGRADSRRRMASQSAASLASSFGGKNSKLTDGLGDASMPGIDRVSCAGRTRREGCPSAMAVRLVEGARRRLMASTR